MAHFIDALARVGFTSQKSSKKPGYRQTMIFDLIISYGRKSKGRMSRIPSTGQKAMNFSNEAHPSLALATYQARGIFQWSISDKLKNKLCF